MPPLTPGRNLRRARNHLGSGKPCILLRGSFHTCVHRVRTLLATRFVISDISSLFFPMLTIPHCKESLSTAYVTAVVGRARHNLWVVRDHDYKVDGSIKQLVIRGGKHCESGFGVDFQAKSSVVWEYDGGEVLYDLEAETYNYLIMRSSNSSQPCILVVLCLDRDDSRWLETSEDELILRNCVYWLQISGARTTIPQLREFGSRVQIGLLRTP
jgi:Domain of unknown function (DUF4365)